MTWTEISRVGESGESDLLEAVVAIVLGPHNVVGVPLDEDDADKCARSSTTRLGAEESELAMVSFAENRSVCRSTSTVTTTGTLGAGGATEAYCDCIARFQIFRRPYMMQNTVVVFPPYEQTIAKKTENLRYI